MLYRKVVLAPLRAVPVCAADPDRELVARAQGGEEEAFEELVRRHEGEVYRLCRRLLGLREDAMDAAQETFVRVFRGLARFRGEAKFRTWVYGIALNVCRNVATSAPRRAAARSTSLAAPPGEEAGAVELPDERPNPEREARGRELGRALEAALAELSWEHRQVILLREMEGLSCEEVAAVLGCRLGTVKSRLARARGALLARLAGVWP